MQNSDGSCVICNQETGSGSSVLFLRACEHIVHVGCVKNGFRAGRCPIDDQLLDVEQIYALTADAMIFDPPVPSRFTRLKDNERQLVGSDLANTRRNIAWILRYELDRYTDAVNWLNGAYHADSSNPNMLLDYADCLEKGVGIAQDREQAIEFRQQASLLVAATDRKNHAFLGDLFTPVKVGSQNGPSWQLNSSSCSYPFRSQNLSTGIDPAALSVVRYFISAIQSNPDLLHTSDLAFFTDYLRSLRDSAHLCSIFSPTIHRVTSLADWDALVKQSASKPIIVNFLTERCGLCKMVTPRFEEMAEEVGRYAVLVKIDADIAIDVAEKFGVTSMTTFKLFVEGREIDEVLGADVQALRQMIARVACLTNEKEKKLAGEEEKTEQEERTDEGQVEHADKEQVDEEQVEHADRGHAVKKQGSDVEGKQGEHTDEGKGKRTDEGKRVYSDGEEEKHADKEHAEEKQEEDTDERKREHTDEEQGKQADEEQGKPVDEEHAGEKQKEHADDEQGGFVEKDDETKLLLVMEKDPGVLAKTDCDVKPVDVPMGSFNVEISESQMDKQMDFRMVASQLTAGGDLDDALQSWNKVIAIRASPLTLAKRANVFLRLKQPYAAIRDCDKALEANPDSAQSLKIRGMAYRLLGDWEKAALSLQRGNQLDYDEEAGEVQRIVEERWNKIREFRLQKAARAREKAQRKIPEERAQARAEAIRRYKQQYVEKVERNDEERKETRKGRKTKARWNAMRHA